MTGRIVSLNRSNGGVPKGPVTEVAVSPHGMDGDRQKHLNHHGGLERAICLYSFELIEALRAEGHPIVPGATGENVTIQHLDWRDVQPGARLQIGTVTLDVTAYAWPCKQIEHAFADRNSTRISEKVHPGWSRVYARVTGSGVLHVGDTVDLVAPPSLRSA